MHQEASFLLHFFFGSLFFGVYVSRVSSHEEARSVLCRGTSKTFVHRTVCKTWLQFTYEETSKIVRIFLCSVFPTLPLSFSVLLHPVNQFLLMEVCLKHGGFKPHVVIGATMRDSISNSIWYKDTLIFFFFFGWTVGVRSVDCYIVLV